MDLSVSTKSVSYYIWFFVKSNDSRSGYWLFSVDLLFYSTLECFYIQSCIQMLLSYRLFECDDIYLPINLSNITALDLHVNNVFVLDTTLEHIVSNLFVDNWTRSVDYVSHYTQCKPNICTYTYIQQYQTVFVITSVIGLLGGLTTVLRILVPPSVKIM